MLSSGMWANRYPRPAPECCWAQPQATRGCPAASGLAPLLGSQLQCSNPPSQSPQPARLLHGCVSGSAEAPRHQCTELKCKATTWHGGHDAQLDARTSRAVVALGCTHDARSCTAAWMAPLAVVRTCTSRIDRRCSCARVRVPRPRSFTRPSQCPAPALQTNLGVLVPVGDRHQAVLEVAALRPRAAGREGQQPEVRALAAQEVAGQVRHGLPPGRRRHAFPRAPRAPSNLTPAERPTSRRGAPLAPGPGRPARGGRLWRRVGGVHRASRPAQL